MSDSTYFYFTERAGVNKVAFRQDSEAVTISNCMLAAKTINIGTKQLNIPSQSYCANSGQTYDAKSNLVCEKRDDRPPGCYVVPTNPDEL